MTVKKNRYFLFFLFIGIYLLFSGCPPNTKIITINPAASDLVVGETITLAASVQPADSGYLFTWSSNNENIAQIETIPGNNGTSGILVRGIRAGLAIITATSAADSGISGTCYINVVTKPYTAALSETQLTMTQDEKTSLVLNFNPVDIIQEIDRKEWLSTNPGIAVVDTAGLITALEPGLTDIIVKIYLKASPALPSKTAVCHLTVLHNELTNDVPVNSDTTFSLEKWYYFNGAVDSWYDISWTGNIVVSAYRGKLQDQSYFTDNETGNARIQAANTGRIYLKVVPKEPGGSFQIQYHLDTALIPDTWTFLFYINGTHSLDIWNLMNVNEMLAGFHENIHINVLILLNKETTEKGEIFTEDFTDTRLYMMVNDNPGGRLERIREGFAGITSAQVYNANMGDAVTLKQFIDFGKANFLADSTALIIMGHGAGPFGFSYDEVPVQDSLHIGEISALLTSGQHVDLLGFNACLMGSLEVAYQFRNVTATNPGDTRFYADIMVAFPETASVFAWSFESVFKRITINPLPTAEIDDLNAVPGTHETEYDPAALDALTLGNLFVEEHRDSMRDEFGESSGTFGSDGLICYDLTKVKAVKEAVDSLAVQLYTNAEQTAIEALRDDIFKVKILSLDFDSDGTLKTYICPLYDLIDLCNELTNVFNDPINSAAGAVLTAVNAMIHYSYYMFTPANTPGLSIFFVDHNDFMLEKDSSWDHFRENQCWYTPHTITAEKRNTVPEQFYGNIDFCKDAADAIIEGNGVVENWFELLDAWYYTGDPEGPNTQYNDYDY